MYGSWKCEDGGSGISNERRGDAIEHRVGGGDSSSICVQDDDATYNSNTSTAQGIFWRWCCAYQQCAWAVGMSSVHQLYVSSYSSGILFLSSLFVFQLPWDLIFCFWLQEEDVSSYGMKEEALSSVQLRKLFLSDTRSYVAMPSDASHSLWDPNPKSWQWIHLCQLSGCDWRRCL